MIEIIGMMVMVEAIIIDGVVVVKADGEGQTNGMQMDGEVKIDGMQIEEMQIDGEKRTDGALLEET